MLPPTRRFGGTIPPAGGEYGHRVIGCALEVHRESVEEVKGIHEAQLLTYMKLAGVKTGLLINFNVTKLKTGIKRFVL